MAEGARSGGKSAARFCRFVGSGTGTQTRSREALAAVNGHVLAGSECRRKPSREFKGVPESMRVFPGLESETRRIEVLWIRVMFTLVV